jgi:cytochrome P450
MLDASFLNDPYPTYHALRAAGPLHWSQEFFGGAWLLPHYADVAAVLRDPRFSSRRAGGWVNGSGPAARTELNEFKRIFARSLLFLNAPQHTRLRQVINAGFKPAVLEKTAPRIQAIVDRLLDRIEPADEIDFMREFARPLPALAIADQLGVDAADRADVLAWSDDIAAFIGSPLPSMEVARRAQAGLVALTDYFRAILPHRRRHLGDDLVSLLIRAEDAGKIITTKELLAQCSTLLFAGIETTRNLLGNGVLALLNHPDQWQRLKQSPALVPSAVRELLRFDSPVQYTGRRIKIDVEMHGRRLRKGELVIPLVGAANRDPAKFCQPDVLDIARPEGSHLSFGYGPHVCVGAALTCLEAEVAFKSLIQRLPDLQLVGDKPQWTANAVYRGLAALPVTLRRAGQSFSVSPIEIPMIPTIKLHSPSKAEIPAQGTPRWSVEQVIALLELPFSDLMFRAQAVHHEHFDPNAVQLSTLLSIKTGGCPEDCGYCPQAARYHTGVANQRCSRWRRSWLRRKPPRPMAPPASAWARPGAVPSRKIWNRCWRWLKRWRRWA